MSFNKIRNIYSAAHYGKSLLWYTSEFLFGYFLAEVYKIPPSVIGTLLFIFLIWDAISDPILVFIIARKEVTTKRLIKYQFIGALLSAFSFFIIFFKPDLSSFNLSLYALFTGILFRTAYTYYDVPQNTLIRRLGDNALQRLSLSTYRSAFSSIAALTVSFATLFVLRNEDIKEQEVSFLLTAGILVLISVFLSFLLTRVAIKEQINTDELHPIGRLSNFRILKMLVLNPKLVYLNISIFLLSLGWPLTFKLIPFFTTYVHDTQAYTGIIFAVMAIANIACQPLWLFVGRKSNAKISFIIASILVCISCIIFTLTSAINLSIACLAIALISASISGLNVYLWVLVSEIISTSRVFVTYDTIIFGLFTFSAKIGLGFSGFLLGVTLNIIGYEQGFTLQGTGSLNLVLIMGLFPGLSAICTAVFALKAISKSS
jgi:Na+/melibiose symporter-like transporter